MEDDREPREARKGNLILLGEEGFAITTGFGSKRRSESHCGVDLAASERGLLN